MKTLSQTLNESLNESISKAPLTKNDFAFAFGSNTHEKTSMVKLLDGIKLLPKELETAIDGIVCNHLGEQGYIESKYISKIESNINIALKAQGYSIIVKLSSKTDDYIHVVIGSSQTDINNDDYNISDLAKFVVSKVK